MRYASLLPTLCVPALLSAQPWCTPGAEWHWTKYGFEMSGYAHDRYVQDTLVGGRMAQHIHRSGYIILHWVSDTVAVEQDHFTAVDGSTVLLWTEHTTDWQWDTLFRFDAAPSDSWVPAGDFWSEGSCVLTVMDTATVVLDGLPLRQLTASFHAPDIGPFEWTQTITERIGHEWGNWTMPYSCVVDGDADIFRCYHDADISVTAPQWNWGCDSGTSVREVVGVGITALPNPGRSFTLTGYSGVGTVQLFDASGRSISRHFVGNGHQTIHGDELAPGMYHYRLMNTSGALIAQGTWLRME